MIKGKEGFVMKKKVLKAAGVLSALAVVIAGILLRPIAAEAVNGGQVTFNKYLVMDQKANVPNATFEFEVKAGDPIAADVDNNKPAVKAGIGSPTITKAVFTAPTASGSAAGTSGGTETYASVQTTDTVTLKEGEKYAKQTVTVDFTAVTFPEPGIYRYIITEKTAAADGITNDADLRVLDVYVESDDEGELSVTGNVLHKKLDIKGNEGGTYGTDKDDGFTNTYVTNDLTISKSVTGNQGFRNKYFKFVVNISGASAGTVYTVDLSKATTGSISGVDAVNPSFIITSADGTGEGIFYLKNGESIVIQGLTAGTSYTVSEENEDYIASYVIDGGQSVNDNKTETQTMGTIDHRVAFTNRREGTVPTGIMLDVAPYLGMVLIAGIACILLFGRKRRRR